MKDQKTNWFKKHKILTALGVFVLLIIVVSVATGGDTDTNTSQSAETNTNTGEQEKVAKVGQPVRDGKFEFTVSKIKCGEKSVGDEFLNEKAQGEFCRLSLSIKNIGNEAQSLFSSDQKLIDDQGREFNADDTATIYAASDDSGSTWFDEINPGNSVKGDIIFDVPADAKVVKVELHDSSLSNGVEVKLN